MCLPRAMPPSAALSEPLHNPKGKQQQQKRERNQTKQTKWPNSLQRAPVLTAASDRQQPGVSARCSPVGLSCKKNLGFYLASSERRKKGHISKPQIPWGEETCAAQQPLQYGSRKRGAGGSLKGGSPAVTDASPGHHKSQSRMDLHYPNISLLPKPSGGNGGREVAPVPDFFLRSLPVKPLGYPRKGHVVGSVPQGSCPLCPEK